MSRVLVREVCSARARRQRSSHIRPPQRNVQSGPRSRHLAEKSGKVRKGRQRQRRTLLLRSALAIALLHLKLLGHRVRNVDNRDRNARHRSHVHPVRFRRDTLDHAVKKRDGPVVVVVHVGHEAAADERAAGKLAREHGVVSGEESEAANPGDEVVQNGEGDGLERAKRLG